MMFPHRLLLLISNLEYGGAQRQLIELANNLDKRRFSVHVCSLSNYVPLATHINKNSIQLHIIQKRFKYDLTVILRLSQLLKKLRVDVVQSYLFDANIAARLAGKLAKTPVIINTERNTDYYLKPVQLAGFRLTKKYVDLFIANSHAGADFNSKKLGHPASMYRVVHNGVNIEKFFPSENKELRRDLGISEEEHVVGMFASFKKQKNHPLIFSAAKILLDRIPNIRFLFVGDVLHGSIQSSNKYKEQVNSMVDDLGIRSHCIFLGNRDDVEKIYSVCDVTVLPSLFEGTPNVLLESMACGVPVVATDVSDNAKLVNDGQTGYLVPLNDVGLLVERLYSLLIDSNLCQKMGQAAREWIKQEYSTAMLAHKTEKVLYEFFPNRGGNASLKVALLTKFPQNMTEPKGGVEAVSVNLAQTLSTFKDLDVHVVTTELGLSKLVVKEHKNLTVHYLPREKGGMLWNVVFSGRHHVLKYIRALSPDIVHSHDTYGIMLKGVKTPRVFTIHGFIYADTLVSEEHWAWLRSKIWRCLETSGWADQPNVISISPYVRERINRFVKGNIYDIKNPVSEEFFLISRKEKKGTIFSAAEISPRKNTLILVEAFSKLVEEGYSIELRLAGTISNLDYGLSVKELIHKLCLDERVFILGRLNVAQVQHELSTASIFALVSLEENSPMGIEEAMAASLPIVTSNRCGMPYIINDNENGFLVDPHDPVEIGERLRQLLDDDDLRKAMGQKSREIALNNFHPEQIARHTKDVYYKIFYNYNV